MNPNIKALTDIIEKRKAARKAAAHIMRQVVPNPLKNPGHAVDNGPLENSITPAESYIEAQPAPEAPTIPEILASPEAPSTPEILESPEAAEGQDISSESIVPSIPESCVEEANALKPKKKYKKKGKALDASPAASEGEI